MVKKFTVGVIGAGRIGKIHIENLLHKISGINLKVVADIEISNELKSVIAKNIIKYYEEE